MRNLYHTHEDRDRNEQHLPAETILKKEGDRDGEMRGEPRGGGGGQESDGMRSVRRSCEEPS
jgi:hypothetical protein